MTFWTKNKGCATEGRPAKSRHRVIVRLITFGLIGAVWLVGSVLVLLGLMAHIENQGGRVNRLAFYSGTVLVSFVIWLGLGCGSLLRRRVSLRVSVASGCAFALICAAFGYGLVALAIQLP